MRFPTSLSARLVAVGAAVLAVAMTSIGLTLWVTWQLEGGGAAINEAGRLRMQTWQLAYRMQSDDRPAVAAALERVDAGLALLRRGDPARPLFVPWDDDTRQRLDAVTADWERLRPLWSVQPPPPDLGRQADALVQDIDAFVEAIEHRLAGWTSILHLFQLGLLGLALAGTVAAAYAGYLFVIAPIERLRQGVARVRAGDLGTRLDPPASDELGTLTQGFNEMASALQDLYRTLEDKVREKTQRLEQQHGRLSALYEVSAALAQATELQPMAQAFARQVRRVAGADAAAIRWSDEANQRYLMLAGDCLPADFDRDEHCVAAGDCQCGPAVPEGPARVIPIRVLSSLGHCARAGFETLLSVPVQLHGRVMGEIDLFYRRPAAPTDEELSLLDALATHLASAMESLRAQALERESAVAEERALIARELHDSIAQSLSFLKIQVGLLRGALARGDRDATAAALDELDVGVRESTADVRELLMHFRTRTTGEDIGPALRTTLLKFEQQTGLPAHLEMRGHGLPLAPDAQVQVLHVVQEALSNVRKHAGASQVWLTLQQGPQWQIEVRDDGHGFDAAGPGPDETHVGLRIMRERAARVGAVVRVESTPGHGTRVTIAPRDRAEAPAGSPAEAGAA